MCRRPAARPIKNGEGSGQARRPPLQFQVRAQSREGGNRDRCYRGSGRCDGPDSQGRVPYRSRPSHALPRTYPIGYNGRDQADQGLHSLVPQDPGYAGAGADTDPSPAAVAR